MYKDLFVDITGTEIECDYCGAIFDPDLDYEPEEDQCPNCGKPYN